MGKVIALRSLASSCILAICLLWFLRFYPNDHRGPLSIYPNNAREPTVEHHPLTTPLPVPVPVSETSLTAFAYVFYATAPTYACSVLVNIDRLQRLFDTKHRIIVLVKPDLPSSYLSAFTARNATVIPYEPPPNPTTNVPYYEDVLLKLITFRLHHYIPSLKRVLVLDADQMILQSLDHVFGLPEVDLAAPRAYWAMGFCSAFLLVSLSDRLWELMESKIQAPAIGEFDMDILNEMFEKTVLLLPGNYATLNSHWETNEIPSWWQGTIPPKDPEWQPSPFSAVAPPASGNLTVWNSTEGGNESEEEKSEAEQEKEHFQNEEIRERRLRLDAALENVYGVVKVLHFSALGKPWSWPVDWVTEEKPEAHPLLAAQFGEWRQAARNLCPAMGDIDL